MTNKWVIFDFDGTISETTIALADLWNECVAKKYKLKVIQEEDLLTLRNLTAIEKIKYLKVPFYKMPFVIGTARKGFLKHLDNFAIISGLRDVCQKFIDSGFHLAIISSNKEANIRRYLGKNNFEIFDEIFCDKGRSLFVKHKTIRKFLAEHKIPAENIVYVGDESRDVVACKKAGVEIVSVSWGWDSRDVLKLVNPDNLADTPKELYENVVRILGK